MSEIISEDLQSRFLKVLGATKSGHEMRPDSDGGFQFSYANCQLYLNRIQFQHLQHLGFITHSEASISVTKLGRNFLKKYTLRKNEASVKSEVTRIATQSVYRNSTKPRINPNESPLSRLYSRKTKGGKRYLSQIEFEAGERIRRDFEKANLQPSLGMQYSTMQAGNNPGKNTNQAADISDFAIDARARVNNAIDAVGPELSGTVLDICCFLKGFELVERERNWPPRSAKLMLKTGLSKLARYYGFENRKHERAGNIARWGTSDFRPSLFPMAKN